MVKLHLRSFQKKAYIAADGTVVFPGATELSDANIPSGGTLVYEDNGTDVQQQVTANATALTTLQASGHAHVDAFVYVDAARSEETYTETGSEVAPYRTLSAAVTAKLADSETDPVVIKLRPGNYVGTISRDKQSANQMFEIRGSGADNTHILGSSGWDATTSSVLYFRDFISIKISDVSINNGAYGIYIRGTNLVEVENCQFAYLGSSGANHEFTRTQSQMAADWATQGQVGSNRSNGGVMRLRGCLQVSVLNCYSSNTLRGIRIQDCAQGRVAGCDVSRSLESGIYLAAGDYTGTTGSSNFVISDCRVIDSYNNSYLVIGGSNNTIINCIAEKGANSAVAGWHTQDLRVQGCSFDKCTQKIYNGIGSLADSYGCVMFGGKANLTDTGGYMLVALNNSMLRCGQGRAAAITGFWFGELDHTITSYRAVIDSNNMDAPTPWHKDDQNIPLTTTVYPSPPASGPSQSEFDALETDVVGNTSDITVNTNSITVAGGDIADNFGLIGTNTTALENRLTLDTAQTLTSGWLSITKANDDATLWVTRTGSTTLKLEARNGHGRLRYSGAKFDLWSSGRYKMDGSHLQIPMNSSAPVDNAANSKGGLWVDSSTSPYKLMFHDGVQWKEVSLS